MPCSKEKQQESRRPSGDAVFTNRSTPRLTAHRGSRVILARRSTLSPGDVEEHNHVWYGILWSMHKLTYRAAPPTVLFVPSLPPPPVSSHLLHTLSHFLFLATSFSTPASHPSVSSSLSTRCAKYLFTTLGRGPLVPLIRDSRLEKFATSTLYFSLASFFTLQFYESRQTKLILQRHLLQRGWDFHDILCRCSEQLLMELSTGAMLYFF